MARDQLLTDNKLSRAEGALDTLLACADLELRVHVERARRAVSVNRIWRQSELAARAEHGDPNDFADETMDVSVEETPIPGEQTPPEPLAVVPTTD